MTPTKAGEGKTTTSIGLTDGLNLLLKGSKKVACACLRQPSLGPFFGMKGGATGGGKASVEPDERINVHFTGDLHAISSASLLISAVIENSIYQGNTLNINKDRIVFLELSMSTIELLEKFKSIIKLEFIRMRLS